MINCNPTILRNKVLGLDGNYVDLTLSINMVLRDELHLILVLWKYTQVENINTKPQGVFQAEVQ